MIHGGDDLSEVQEAAKLAVMRYFVAVAESDNTPPTLRALYVLKAQEAKLVVDGLPSSMIEGEARMRGITPLQMATVILDMAKASETLELARMQTNVRIEAAKDEADIVDILAELGLELRL